VNTSIQVLPKKWETRRLVVAMSQVVQRANWSDSNQISLSCREGEQEFNEWVYAHGDPVRPFTRDGHVIHQESDFGGFLKGFETASPYFFEIWKHLVSEYGHVYRMRLIKLRPRTCLSFHADYNRRIHIPIISNDRCYMVINETDQHPPKNSSTHVDSLETHRLSADGSMYLVDTRHPHTAFNGGEVDRVHLVCSI